MSELQALLEACLQRGVVVFVIGGFSYSTLSRLMSRGSGIKQKKPDSWRY